MKQQQLTFEKGITNVPSDAVCSDNTLSESVGMVYENGEHRVIQQPKAYMTLASGQLRYVHKLDVDRFIYTTKSGSNYYLHWKTIDGSASGDIPNVNPQTPFTTSDNQTYSSIGKTLIVSDGGKMHYFLWKGTGYDSLDEIPDIDIEFKLYDGRFDWKDKDADDYGDMTGIVTGQASAGHPLFGIEDGKQEDYNNLIIGRYAYNKKKASKKLRFTRPFFVRAAIEMYDGSFTKMTSPILMTPSFGTNDNLEQTQGDTNPVYANGGGTYVIANKSKEKLTMQTLACKMAYKLGTNYTDYSDLVKGVVVFVTDQVETLDIDDDIRSIESVYGVLPTGPDGQGNTRHYHNYTSIHAGGVGNTSQSNWAAHQVFVTFSLSDPLSLENIPLPIARPETDVESDLKEMSVFYKLADIGKASMSTFSDIDKVASGTTLINITTQQQLESDDYYSHTKLAPNTMFAYNSRLNLANVSRSFFKGFRFFLPYENPTLAIYKTYVTIKAEDGSDKIISYQYSTYQKQGLWFYYPDPRATHVIITKVIANVETVILDANLTEHVGLNGAHYLGSLPVNADYDDSFPVTGVTIPDSNNNNDLEQLANYIITSEVNNPFVFLAKGYNKVGTGKIIGMSTLTQALSEGQFGQYPLLVFSEGGIWAMATDNTGLFVSVHPMSREVCNNAGSITQTDGAVFFSSEKGLMVVAGNQVKCVSEQLSGKSSSPFRNFIKNAYIAYDYRDSLLWIFNGTRLCYIYAMKTSTFSRFDFGEGVVVSNVANNYPDFLLQAGTTIFSLLERPDINNDTHLNEQQQTVNNTYNTKLYSRPMKLEDALALKTILQVRHIVDFNADAEMSLAIEASNNLNSWVQLKSLRGMPWKYYKFKYEFSHLLATDRFAGSVIVTEERRTNKLR